QFAVGQAATIHLQFQVRDHRTEVGVAAAFAVAVKHALDVRRAGLDRGERICDGQLAVVVAMDAEFGVREPGANQCDGLGDLFGQTAAIRVAEDDRFGAAVQRGVQGVERVFRTGAEPVEEVFGVVEHAAPAVFQMADGVGDHPQVLFERGLERDVDVKVPGFAEDRHDGRFGGEQSLNDGVICRDGVRAPSAAERGEHRGAQLQRLRALEKFHVFRISAWPTSLDKVDADLIQRAGNFDLVLDRVGQPFALRAVAQCRVINFYNGFFHRIVTVFGSTVFVYRSDQAVNDVA